MKKFAVLWIILTTVLCSCHRYEDGPKISFRKYKKDLIGSYKIYAYENGTTDVTPLLSKYHLDGTITIVFEYTTEGSDYRTGRHYFKYELIKNDTTYFFDGDFYLTDEKSRVYSSIRIDDYSYTYNNQEYEWEEVKYFPGVEEDYYTREKTFVSSYIITRKKDGELWFRDMQDGSVMKWKKI